MTLHLCIRDLVAAITTLFTGYTEVQIKFTFNLVLKVYEKNLYKLVEAAKASYALKNANLKIIILLVTFGRTGVVLFLEIEIGHLPKNILILKTILNNFSIINSFFAESQLSTRKKDFFGYPMFCHYLGTRQRRLIYIESLQSCSQQATISHSL